MAKIAKSVVDVVLGEAAHGTVEQRFEDMVAIFSVIKNRATQLRETPENIVSVQREFNAYNKALPPGAERFRSLAKKAMEYVDQNGPVHKATFFATPKTAHRLPSGKAFETQTSGHQYFSDPEGRAIRTAVGFKTPNRQPVAVANPPVPTSAPRENPQAFDMGRFGDAPPAFDAGRFGDEQQVAQAPQPFDRGRFAGPKVSIPQGFDPERMAANKSASMITGSVMPAPAEAPAFDMARFGNDPQPTASIQQPKSAVSSYLMSAPEVTRGSQRINNEAKSLPPPQPRDAVRNATVWANQQNAKQPSAQRMAADAVLADTAAKVGRTPPTTQVASLGPVAPPARNKIADAYKSRADSLLAMGQLNLSGNKTAKVDLNTGALSEPVFSPDGYKYAPAGSTKEQAAAAAKSQLGPLTSVQKPSLSNVSQTPSIEVPSISPMSSVSDFSTPISSSVPSSARAMDVWQGNAQSGTATDGSTVSAMPDGSIARYVPKYDHTEFTRPDGSYGGLQKGNQLSDAFNNRPNPVNQNGDGINPFSGQAIPPAKSTADKALGSIFSPQNVGKAVGAVAGGMLGGPAGAAIGGKLGGKVGGAATKQAPAPTLWSILTGDAKGYPPAPSPTNKQSNTNNKSTSTSSQMKTATSGTKKGLY